MDAVLYGMIKRIQKDINGRVGSLEDSQRLVLQNYIEEFKNDKYIDKNKTNATVSNGKVSLAKTGAFSENFTDSTHFDKDSSRGVKIENNKVTLIDGMYRGEYQSTTLPTGGTDFAILNVDDTQNSDITFGSKTTIYTSNVIDISVFSKVDRQGKLWRFYSYVVTSSNNSNRLKYEVFNPDGSTYKSLRNFEPQVDSSRYLYLYGSERMDNSLSFDFDYNNNLWLTCMESGGYQSVYKVKPDGTYEKNERSVSSNHVYLARLLVDKDNKVWIYYQDTPLNNSYSTIRRYQIDSVTFEILKVAEQLVPDSGSYNYLKAFDLIISNDNRIFITAIISGNMKLYESFRDSSSTKTIYTLASVSSTYLTGGTAYYNEDDEFIYYFYLDASTNRMSVSKYNIKNNSAYSIITVPFPTSARSSKYYFSNIDYTEKDNYLYIVAYYYDAVSLTEKAFYAVIDKINQRIIKKALFDESENNPVVSIDINTHNDKVFLWVGTNKNILQYNFDNYYTKTKYKLSNDNGNNWFYVENGEMLNFPTNGKELKVAIELETPSYSSLISPVINSFKVEEWGKDMQGEEKKATFVTKPLPVVYNSGKGKFFATQELNNGKIEWYISNDNGTNWNVLPYGQEFDFSSYIGDTIILKAELFSPASEMMSPEITKYTLQTSSVVMQTDLEEITINLMKTNFKIDSFTNASKNGLQNMTIDVFSDTKGINEDLSTYTFDPNLKAVGGTTIVSKVDKIKENTNIILLTVDELPTTGSTTYEVSRDGGQTWLNIIPNTQMSIRPLGKGTDLVLKANFTGDAKLTAWAYAWN